MARKKTDVRELARALKAPNFKNADATSNLTELEPVSPTTLVLRVSEITAYAHNPRQAENREYPRLKDSIRTRRGLTTPLTVTKRPGDKLYTIAAGGNSRLRILQELAEESGDEAFASVTCRFEPWDSEYQVFANHLIENDIRGTMTFGDRARAIVEWRRLYEESHPDEPPLSQRQLVDRLAETGYRVPRTLITPLLYTAELLLPHLPIAFSSGMGRPAAERLVRLRTCSAEYWEHNITRVKRVTDSVFESLFAEVCAQQDCHCADWDHELFQGALTIRMAQALALDHKLVALDIDSLFHGHSLQSSEEPTALRPPKDPQGIKSEWAFDRSREIDAIRMERARARIEAGASAGMQPDGPDGEAALLAADGTTTLAPAAGARFEPSQLRENNYVAARRLAASHDLAQFLNPVNTGLGFFIEAPEPSAVHPESRDREAGPGQGLVLIGIRSGLWWLLCLTADQLAPSHLTALGRSFPASWLVELFTVLPTRSPETDAVAALHLLVGEPTAHGLVVDVLTDPSFTDEDQGALDRLLRGCRALRAGAADGAFDLWDPAP